MSIPFSKFFKKNNRHQLMAIIQEEEVGS